MSITDWPIDERPREKLLQKGVSSLTDAELIAIILKTGTRGKTALDIARDLLKEHGHLKRLLQTPFSIFRQKTGIGQAKYALLKAAFELGKRCHTEPIPIGQALNSHLLTQQFLAARLRDETHECFGCLFLDNQLRLLAFEILFQGTINAAPVYPREIVRRGLIHNAAKIILTHNHPSGNALPSKADKETTLVIKQALNLVDMDVIDHIIIGNPGEFSFAEAGLL
jgi:DNA repair protein RadC